MFTMFPWSVKAIIGRSEKSIDSEKEKYQKTRRQDSLKKRTPISTGDIFGEEECGRLYDPANSAYFFDESVIHSELPFSIATSFTAFALAARLASEMMIVVALVACLALKRMIVVASAACLALKRMIHDHGTKNKTVLHILG